MSAACLLDTGEKLIFKKSYSLGRAVAVLVANAKSTLEFGHYLEYSVLIVGTNLILAKEIGSTIAKWCCQTCQGKHYSKIYPLARSLWVAGPAANGFPNSIRLFFADVIQQGV